MLGSEVCPYVLAVFVCLNIEKTKVSPYKGPGSNPLNFTNVLVGTFETKACQISTKLH